MNTSVMYVLIILFVLIIICLVYYYYYVQHYSNMRKYQLKLFNDEIELNNEYENTFIIANET